jgi:hypothetical protein
LPLAETKLPATFQTDVSRPTFRNLSFHETRPVLLDQPWNDKFWRAGTSAEMNLSFHPNQQFGPEYR